MNREISRSPEDILEEKIDRLQRGREWKHFLAECLVLAVAVYVLFQYVIGITFMSGTSMEPTLRDGDLVIFYRLDSEYRENDIVVVREEGKQETVRRMTDVEALSREEIVGRVCFHMGAVR